MNRRASLILTVAPLVLAAAPPPLAMTGAAPSAESVSLGSPVVVELTFNENLLPSRCGLTVANSAGKRVDDRDLHPIADNAHIGVTVNALLPGHYTVHWHVVGMDNRHAAGQYGFTVGQ